MWCSSVQSGGEKCILPDIEQAMKPWCVMNDRNSMPSQYVCLKWPNNPFWDFQLFNVLCDICPSFQLLIMSVWTTQEALWFFCYLYSMMLNVRRDIAGYLRWDRMQLRNVFFKVGRSADCSAWGWIFVCVFWASVASRSQCNKKSEAQKRMLSKRTSKSRMLYFKKCKLKILEWPSVKSRWSFGGD